MKTFVILILVVSTKGFLFGKTPDPDWDKLSVKFPSYTSRPKTEAEAIAAGWKQNGDGCKNGNYKGKRYVLNGVSANMLLFDHNGRIAGVQFGVPDTFKIPTQHAKAHLKEGNEYILTAYFTDPNTICSGARKTPDGYVGDKLYLVMNDGPTEIPLKEDDVKNTKWTKGKCFYGMGMHYWYNIRENMDCNEFAPFFLLYNGGKLNAFGFAEFGALDKKSDGVVEHPFRCRGGGEGALQRAHQFGEPGQVLHARLRVDPPDGKPSGHQDVGRHGERRRRDAGRAGGRGDQLRRRERREGPRLRVYNAPRQVHVQGHPQRRHMRHHALPEVHQRRLEDRLRPTLYRTGARGRPAKILSGCMQKK